MSDRLDDLSLKKGGSKSRYRLKLVWIIPIAVLLILSALSMNPAFWSMVGIKSSTDPDVTQRRTETDTEVRLDYVNADGEIIRVTDKNYSTIIQTLDENGHAVKEEYLDDKGRPVNLPAGYATLCRTFNKDGKIESEQYFDEDGKPARHYDSYYGVHYIYDRRGNLTSIFYLGPDMLPAPNDEGITVKLRAYDDENRLVEEAYVDGSGQVVALPKGESGYINRYGSDGHIEEVVFVDGTGQPVMTARGYSIVKKSYAADGRLEREMYLDTDRKPVTLRRGYSGVRYERGKRIYIDQNGNDVFMLSAFLNGSHWAVALVGVALCVFAIRSGKIVNAALLVLYLLFIAYMTLMYRESGLGRINLDLFWSYRQFLTNKGLRYEILNNIWLFVPLGAILYKLFPKPGIVIVPVLISASIETAQYVFGIGLCELDDIVSNSLGGLIGILMCMSFYSGEENSDGGGSDSDKVQRTGDGGGDESDKEQRPGTDENLM